MNNAQNHTTEAARSKSLPVVRGLVRAYQAFIGYDSHSLSQFNLTVPQADVLFTLGNTNGMTFKEIGAKTLTSKGTLTGIIARMASKGIVCISVHSTDARARLVSLTTKGIAMFEDIFPRHISALDLRILKMPAAEREELIKSLTRLEQLLS